MSAAHPGQGKHSIFEPETGHAREALKPSEVSAPTRVVSEPQQASTQPGDGGKRHTEHDVAGSQPNVPPQAGKVPWKDRVLGYAKVARGKMLGKQGTQDVGHKILQGEISPKETKPSH